MSTHGPHPKAEALGQNPVILNWYVGRRTHITSCEFLRVLKSRLADERFQLTTDCFAPYCAYLGSVFKVFRERIDYGTEFKKFATLVDGVRPEK